MKIKGMMTILKSFVALGPLLVLPVYQLPHLKGCARFLFLLPSLVSGLLFLDSGVIYSKYFVKKQLQVSIAARVVVIYFLRTCQPEDNPHIS